ncbi:MAG: hypothetical protein WBN34_09355 [Woeseia sp.]
MLLLALAGANHKALTQTRHAIIADIGERRMDRARREFLEICDTHEDYLWDIDLETP